MEDIRIYDTDFNLLYIENKVISSNWTIYFNSVGTFEIHTLPHADIAEIILENLDISKNKIPIIVQGDLQGIVTGVRLSGDLAIYGKTCNWLLSKKIVPKFITHDLPTQCNPEDVARYLVSEAFSDQDNFLLGEKVNLSDMDTFWRNTYNPLSEVVKDLLVRENAGHNIFFDVKNRNWIFNVLPRNQSNVILSDANSNVFNTEYTVSIDDYYSCCWYEQEQDFVNGEFPDPVWTKLIKDEKSGIFRSECVVESTVESEAESLLLGKKVKSEIVTDVCGLDYGKDYRLGDILRVQYVNGKISRTEQKQVSGISIGEEEGKSQVEVILRSL